MAHPCWAALRRRPPRRSPPPPRRRFRKPEGATVEIVRDPLRLAQAGAGAVTDYRIAPLGGTQLEPDAAVRVRLRKEDHWVTAEVDESFGHARVDLASPRRDANAQNAVGHALSVLCGDLAPRGVTSVFGVCAVGDAWASEVYAALGFKVTARLADHLVGPDGFQHAAVFHTKLGE